MRPVVGFPMLTHPLQFCSQCSIEWSLACSLVLRNEGILSFFFLSKTCENFRGGFEIFSCFHWSTLTILIVAHQRAGALVPVPLMPGCGIRDVDRREVVQVSIGKILLSFRGLAENFDTYHPLAT